MSDFLVAAVFVSWSAAPFSTPPAYEVAGCYAVSVGAWMPAANLGPNATLLVPPLHINLTSEPGIGFWGQRHFMVVPALGATAQHEIMYWGVTPDADVRIVLERSVFGLVLSLRPRGPELTGTAHTYWRGPDNRYPEQSAPVMLSRVSCIPSAAHAG